MKDHILLAFAAALCRRMPRIIAPAIGTALGYGHKQNEVH